MNIELLFDQPQVGSSQYGEYYLYAVRNTDGAEYSYFAPPEVHQHLKDLKKGDRATILKIAEQKGSKIVTRYEVAVEKQLPNQPVLASASGPDPFYEQMLQSCKDAVKISTEIGGMMDPKNIAVTLFIARSKGNGFGGANV